MNELLYIHTFGALPAFNTRIASPCLTISSFILLAELLPAEAVEPVDVVNSLDAPSAADLDFLAPLPDEEPPCIQVYRVTFLLQA